MYDAILGIFGQSAKQAAERDMKDFDPSKGEFGGLKQREGLEVLGDYLRGGPDAVNEAARELQVENLKGTQSYRDINLYGEEGKPTVTSSTSQDFLDRKALEAKQKYARTQKQENYKSDPDVQRLIKKENDALIYQKGRDREGDRRFESNRLDALDARRATTALGMAQLDITRQQEANRMAEETRRYNERRSDSKRERMAAIIAGLANLGGAFAI
jgi:hypothetical protein